MLRLLSVWLLFFFVLPFSVQAAAPQDQVKQMVEGVFEVLNSNESAAVKKKEISGTVQKYLGVDSLAQRTLGIYWKQGSAAELKRFKALYIQILENTYLNRIEDYSGGKVDFLQERIKDDKAILDTEFVTQQQKIPVQYKLVKEGDVWQIYDVLIEGVSLVRSYRSSYTEILRKEGFDGLFKLMDEKIAQMNKGA